MRFSEETLMAYADGELDADTRAAVEAAMAEDADLADAVALQIENRHALQAKLHAAFDGALNEALPMRLLDAAQAPPDGAPLSRARRSDDEPGIPADAGIHPALPSAASVTDLSATREAKQATRTRWSAPQWGAIAASLIVGVIVGGTVPNRDDTAFVIERGRMTARAELDTALSTQAGGAIDRDTGIQIGVSYLAKNGDYCRTFTLKDGQVLAGLACRRNSQWSIDALTPTKADASGTYRMANANVPALILGLVEDTIAGDPLDAEQEAYARNRGWQR
jgi:hypothetical protein